MITASVPAGLQLTRAGPADNAAILRFMDGQAMNAGLSLRFDRSPDYFALHDAHSPGSETWLLRRGDEILGTGTFVLRQAWVGGDIENSVYLADLRLSTSRVVAGLWRPLMRDILTDIYERTGARFAWCSILRDNNAARQALLRSRDSNPTPFEHLAGYSNVSIVARRRTNARAHAYAVRSARADDHDQLRAFVYSQSANTVFGPVFDAAVWAHRLQTWPDFALENFVLAFDSNDQLVGCLAPWDSSSINRIVIEQLPRSAEMVRLICNLLSPVTRRPKVRTGSGAWLPDIALSHIFVEGRSADVFAALLRSAIDSIFSTGTHATVSLCVYDDDPLTQALKDYWTVSVPMDLFWIDISALAGGEKSSFPDSASRGFPGFEHYLV